MTRIDSTPKVNIVVDDDDDTKAALSRKNTADTSLASLAAMDDSDDDLYASDDNVQRNELLVELQDVEAQLPREMLQIRQVNDSDKVVTKEPRQARPFWKRLLPDVLEVAACLGFYYFTSLFYEYAVQLNYRPMPIEHVVVVVTSNDNTVQQQESSFARSALFDQRKPDQETVPYYWLRLAGVLCPCLQIVLGLLLQRQQRRRRRRRQEQRTTTPWYRHVSATLCTYIVALAVTQLVTNSVKKYVGYWRPHFFTGCDPSMDYTECLNDHTGSVRKSFPSSHAATMFALMMVLSLYMYKTLGMPSVLHCIPVVDKQMNGTTTVTWVTTYRQGRKGARYLARVMSLVSLLPLAAAIFVASSRVVDNYHHPADVVGGALLGSAVAMFCHGLWFGTNVDADGDDGGDEDEQPNETK